MIEHRSLIKLRSSRLSAGIVFLLLLGQKAIAQPVLDQYIQQGLAQNESIKQQEFALQKSLYALKEAKSLFYPTVSLQGNYTLANGGRTVDFPAGDILNPVYQTLNQLTSSNKFPMLENQQIQLNPNNFYDLKLHTTFPLINAELHYNQRIKQHQVNLYQTEVAIYKRELVKEIKQAYFQYLKATEAINIYRSALKLCQENVRINQSLLANGKINRTALNRSENELTKYQSMEAVAIENRNTAKAYFNFLLSKPAADSITVYIPGNSVAPLPADTSISKREEFAKLKTAAQINQQVIGLNKAYIIPKLGGFVDAGSQGFDMKFNDKSAYYFMGLSLQWDLFTAGKNKYKIKQAETDNAIIQSQTFYVQQQLELQLTKTVNEYKAVQAQYASALSQQQLAERNYNDMLKMYKEGMALFIELLDAQNQLITNQLQTKIFQYDMLAKAAEIERATASFQLN